MNGNKHTYLFASILGIVLFILYVPTPTYAQFFLASTTKTNDIIPFYWIVIILGGIIMLTLSYVSWRKYKALENKKNNKPKKKPNS